MYKYIIKLYLKQKQSWKKYVGFFNRKVYLLGFFVTTEMNPNLSKERDVSEGYGVATQ